MRHSLTTRRLAAAALALAGSAVVGVLAASLTDRPFLVTAVVFAACALAPIGALAWLLLVAPVTAPGDRNAHDNVENHWGQAAAAGAFTDLLVVLGLGLAVVSIADLALQTELVLLVLVLLAMGDASLRYVVLERRAR